jgi:hypothetical protein
LGNCRSSSIRGSILAISEALIEHAAARFDSLALRSAASKPSVTRLDNASGRGHEDALSVARRRMEKT